jgi:hypothetical protein
MSFKRGDNLRKWVEAEGCPHCGEAAHVYFCPKRPFNRGDRVVDSKGVGGTVTRDQSQTGNQMVAVKFDDQAAGEGDSYIHVSKLQPEAKS